MKKPPLKNALNLAVLTAQKTTELGFASCRFDGQISDQGVSAKVMVIPDGYFKSHDGRPFDVANNAWLLDHTAFELLKSAASLRSNDFHFDYEHQTLHAEQNGQPAPASGWFAPTDLEYVPGEGLYALNVRWTPKARALLKNDEYRFISPVFHYDKSTGRPVKLRHFALTNDPAVDGMDKVAVLKSQQHEYSIQQQSNSGETTMNAAQQLLALLGVQVDDGNITDAHYSQANTALTALKAKAQSVAELNNQLSDANDQVAALKANATGVDLRKHVPVDTYNALLSELAVLKNSSDKLTVEQEIQKAQAAGRIISAETDYLIQLGQQNGVAALKAVLDARSPIAALTTQQTIHIAKPHTDGLATLTSEEKYAADQLGISHAVFAKSKQEQK